jgi:hypothetical protein
MSCERFRDAITDHACGAEISAEAAAHLAGCADCRDAFDANRRALADVNAELERALSVAPSPEFVSRLHAHIRVQKSPWAMPAGLAAAAVLVIAVFIAWRTADRQPSASVAAPAALASPAVAAGTPPVASGTPPVASGTPPVASETPPVASGFSRKDAAVAQSDPGAARVLPPNRLRQGFGESAVASAKAEGGSHAALAIATRHTEPEVIVPPDQIRAIARLQELLRNRVLDEATLPPQKAEPEALTDLTIEPLSVSDITLPDIDVSSRRVVTDRERQ